MRKNIEMSDDEEEDEEVKGQEYAQLLSFSCYDTEVYSVYNPYNSVKVSGPKWSKEGGYE